MHLGSSEAEEHQRLVDVVVGDFYVYVSIPTWADARIAQRDRAERIVWDIV